MRNILLTSASVAMVSVASAMTPRDRKATHTALSCKHMAAAMKDDNMGKKNRPTQANIIKLLST